MKRLVLLLLTLPLFGCETVGRHFQQLSECNSEVDSKIPPKYIRVYVRTDTSCSSSGIATPTTTRGDQYIANTNTTCTSTPIYETREENAGERNALRSQCMSKKKSEYENNKINREFQKSKSDEYQSNPSTISSVEQSRLDERNKKIQDINQFSNKQLNALRVGFKVYENCMADIMKTDVGIRYKELLENNGYLTDSQRKILSKYLIEYVTCQGKANDKFQVTRFSDGFANHQNKEKIIFDNLQQKKITIEIAKDLLIDEKLSFKWDYHSLHEKIIDETLKQLRAVQ